MEACSQGIFIGDETEGYQYKNFLIEDNLVYNSIIHGISVDPDSMDGITIRNNTVLTNPNPGQISSIIVSGLNIVIENNVATDVSPMTRV